MYFRYARHTNRLYELEQFYTTILGFKKLGEFKDHDGYDGILIGIENEIWHLEFTQNQEVVMHTFDEDDVLVFYPENQTEYNLLIKKIKEKNIPIVIPKNPYWKANGIQILDPDGFGIIISPLKIKAT